MTSKTIAQTVGAIVPAVNPRLAERIRGRLDNLTKPRGSLGRLEEAALHYGLARGTEMPSLKRKALYVFCSDHGVTAEHVSAYPQAVTGHMVANFVRGGAAINVLCRQYKIEPVIVDMGVAGAEITGALPRKIRRGTRNFTQELAMTPEETIAAVETGITLALERAADFDLYGIGEMGIGNTTSASALLCCFGDMAPEDAVGLGTGIDEATLRNKIAAVYTGLARHQPQASDPLSVLAAVGGYEIAAMTGFVIGAASCRVPVVADGFVTCAAVLAALKLAPDARDYLFYSHISAERAHAAMLRRLGAEPLLSLHMRLGEGSGAAIAMNLIETAIRLYREMATFQEAAVADKL